MVNKLPMTATGIKKLEQERSHLINVERPKIINAIATARELGDLSENAEYQSAREQQAFIEGRIKNLDYVLSIAEEIDISKLKEANTIIFGATVSLKDLESDELKTYQIVGEHEANIENMSISYTSPLGKALIGKTKGDIIDVTTPKSIKSWEVIDFSYVDYGAQQ